MEISILNTKSGDNKITLDTRQARDRKEAQETIRSKLKEGAAVFVKINGEDYRVQSYDPAKDELLVKRTEIVARQRTFRFPGHGTKLTIVPPRAGG